MRSPATHVAGAHVPSIAVLPFDDLSPDKSLGYLGDGMSEDIITMLSRFPDLSVIARNSSFVYKGKPVDIRQIGRDLNVDYALEGSVRKEADQIRITAQLIDTQTGKHVWADRYDKAGKDPLALQDEVTGKIVGAMTGETGQVKQGQYRDAWGKDTADLGEYDYYLRGHDVFMNATSKEENDRAGRDMGRRAGEISGLEPAQGQARMLSLHGWLELRGATTFRRNSARRANWSGRCSPGKTCRRK